MDLPWLCDKMGSYRLLGSPNVFALLFVDSKTA